MRESYGGGWLFYLMLIFLFTYVAFVASVMNYAAAYRSNNYVVSQLEKYEGNVDLDNIKMKINKEYSYDDVVRYTCEFKNSSNVKYVVKTYVTLELPFLPKIMFPPIVVESKNVHGGTCNPNITYE